MNLGLEPFNFDNARHQFMHKLSHSGIVERTQPDKRTLAGFRLRLSLLTLRFD